MLQLGQSTEINGNWQSSLAPIIRIRYFEFITLQMNNPIHSKKAVLSTKDLQLLFRVFTDHYMPVFSKKPLLMRVDELDPTGHVRTLIFHIKYIRNSWAHQSDFSIRVAYRVVETIIWFFDQLRHSEKELESIRLILLKAMCATVCENIYKIQELGKTCLLYTSPSPRDLSTSRMPSSA
eukprot:TRINITY_DN11958_c0_g1_i1.p1 TRINITY_DN11958_c0_g1~~TRINITY_DN11958_c0_g1_i1.p1  ORF type:complete len:179 (-),score=0.22 TRINITY_DN11958_c0_g1_i1:152-688(-)